MTAKARGLGRGLGSLIPSGATVAAAVPGNDFREIALDAIVPNGRNPRQIFDEEALAELSESIKELGLLQPVVVRETGPGRYELIMGERRWRASKIAGLTEIPAIVRETEDDAMLRDALVENIHRTNLNPLEEAAAYNQLLDDFGITHDELASRLHRSRSHVTNTLRLMKLTPAVQRRVAAGVLSAGHARALLAISDPGEQEATAARVVAEGLSVRAVEELVALGEQSKPKAARPKRAQAPVAARAAQVADDLSDRLDTRVTVQAGKGKGKLIIEFASLDDLDRIVVAMNAK